LFASASAESRANKSKAVRLFRVVKRAVCLAFAVLDIASIVAGQSTSQDQTQSTEGKRVLGIIPNYRTSPSLSTYEPLTASEKFKLASRDAFDRGTFILAGMFAGEAQLTNDNRAFGQGAAGFGQYYGAGYGDLFIGDYMTEAVFPTFLHQDPRYFRRGEGSMRSRLAYAIGQIFWTQSDSGGTQFNYSEVLGNATAVAISTAYYRDNRDTGDAVTKLGMQVGVDIASNVIKEFWPDMLRKFHHKQDQKADSAK
jgi:hypothetical protein